MSNICVHSVIRIKFPLPCIYYVYILTNISFLFIATATVFSHEAILAMSFLLKDLKDHQQLPRKGELQKEIRLSVRADPAVACKY